MAVTAYKCPNCGASIQFNAEKKIFDCEYCNSQFTEAEMRAHTEALQKAQAAEVAAGVAAEQAVHAGKQIEAGEAIMYHCEQCGAQIVADENTAATFCLYCQSPTILPTRLSDVFAPDKVIPFKFDKNAAVSAFMDWSKRAWFAPKDFRSQARQEKMSGLYVPFWLFSFTANFDYSGKGTKIKTWSTGNYRYTQTDTYNIVRQGDIQFAHIPADGSKHMENETMDLLEPYNFAELKDFEASYLSGFFAEKYDESKDEVFPRVQKRGETYSDTHIKGTLNGYSSLDMHKRLAFRNTNHQYALLPVWILSYNYNGKLYLFTMNGQTGKVIGKMPTSKPRIIRFGILLGLAIFLVLFVGGMII